jgi:sensor histidine kinase regulating citrate/malate metabolism
VSSGDWSTRRIAIVLYPFAAGAAGVNVFFAALIASWWGAPVLSTVWSFAVGCVLGVPAALAFARHIKRLMAQAEAEGSR